MVAEDPVASALFYERVIAFYADAFFQFPWDADEARGPGLFDVITALIGATEMQGRGNNHFHGEGHTTVSYERIQCWISDGEKRRAFSNIATPLRAPS